MALETTAILRTLLLQILKAEDLEEACDAVKAMCSKDDIASVMEIYHDWQKRKEVKKTSNV